MDKQNTKNDKRILLIILPLIVFICLSVWRFRAYPPHIVVESGDGLWDLRGFDFTAVCADIVGNAEYVPNELLTPEEFAESEHIEALDYMEGADYLTSRIRVQVPEGNYAFCRLSPGHAVRIFVNGKLLGEVGKPAESKNAAVQGERYLFFTAQPLDGMIEIVMQRSNFVHRDNAISHDGWFVGTETMLSKRVTGITAADAVVMGFYLLLFIVHLLLFLTLPSYRVNLWLALLCFAWALRTGCIHIKILLTLIPALTWQTAFRIEYIAIPLTLLLMTLAYHRLFPDAMHKGYRIAACCVTGVFIAIYAVADTLFMSQTILYIEIAAILATIYTLARIVMSVRKPAIEQRILFYGLGVVFLALVIDTLRTNGLIPAALFTQLSEFALVIFFIFQMTAMFFGTMSEVTAAKEAEQRLALENAALERVNQLKNDMMATVAHEMHTPLSVMMGFAQLIAREQKQRSVDTQTTADLDVIASEALRLSQIVDEMQSITKIHESTGFRQPVSLEALTRQIIRLYTPISERKHTRIEIVIEENLPCVFGNEDELTQVLFNLLSNAGKHTENGVVTVRIEKNNSLIRTEVSDNGTGILPELLPHVFGRRVTDGSGSGLGLAICKEIVEAHGGRIWVHSVLGEGTTAAFELPSYEGGGSDG